MFLELFGHLFKILVGYMFFPGMGLYFAFTEVGQPYDHVATRVYGCLAIGVAIIFISEGFITYAEHRTANMELEKRTMARRASR